MGYDLTCILREVDLLEHMQMAGALSEHLGYPLFLLTSVTKWLITFYWNTILKFVLLWRNPTYKKSLLPLILVLLMATKSNLIYPPCIQKPCFNLLSVLSAFLHPLLSKNIN